MDSSLTIFRIDGCPSATLATQRQQIFFVTCLMERVVHTCSVSGGTPSRAGHSRVHRQLKWQTNTNSPSGDSNRNSRSVPQTKQLSTKLVGPAFREINLSICTRSVGRNKNCSQGTVHSQSAMYPPFCSTRSMSTASYAGITNQTEGSMKFTKPKCWANFYLKAERYSAYCPCITNARRVDGQRFKPFQLF